MRAMKDSGIEWIGQVPKSWESRSLKYALDAHSGGAWGSNEGGDETDVICVRIADFDYSKLSVDFHDKMTVRSYTDKAVAESSLKYGDILLEKSGGGEVTPVGRSVLFTGEEGMMCANFIEWLRPNQHFNSCFLNYWLAAAYINGFSKRNVKQTTGIQNLDIPAFLSERIVAPSMIEQKQIAQYLDAKCAEIDALIAAKEKTNALLKERRQSIIYEAVTKGLNPDAPMKDSGIEWIGEIPTDWDVCPVKYLLDKYHPYPIGDGDHGMIKADDYLSEGIPYIRVLNLTWGDGLNLETLVYISEEMNSRIKNSELKPNDILIAKTGATIGKTAIVPASLPRSNTTSHVGKITISGDHEPKFFYYVMTSSIIQTQIKMLSAMQSTRPELGIDGLRNLLTVAPPVEKQREIAEYLDHQCTELNAAIATNASMLEKLKEYRQSIIYEAVTGKIEV